MIHYHGTPVGGPRQEVSRFLTARHSLISYAYKDDIAIAAEVCQSFILDNGAFTAWKNGCELDVDGYIKWVFDWCRHPGFDWALIPDVIDGSDSENDKLLAAFPQSLPGVPVWHMHEPVARLKWLAKKFRIVALGSSGEFASVGTLQWWARMNQALKAICDEQGRPMCKLHGLRMLDPNIFGRLPLSSADSTNAVVNAGSLGRFGSYPAPTKSQRAEVIAARIESFNSAAVFNEMNQEELCLL